MSEINDQMQDEITATKAVVTETVQPEIPELKPEPSGKKKGWIFAAIAAVLIVVVAVAGITLGSASPQKRINQAIENTFSHKSPLLEAMKAFKFSQEEGYTIGMDMGLDDQMAAFEIKGNSKTIQLWAEADLEDIPQIEGRANLTEEKLEVQLSELEDVIFTYNFREPKTGFLQDYASEEELETLDESLALIADNLLGEKRAEALEKKTAVGEELKKLFLEEYMAMEFTKADKATYEIRGKKVECQGYQTVYSGENMRTLLKKVEELYRADDLDYWSKYEEYYKDPFEEIYKDIEESDQLNITVYIGEKRLAAVVLEDGTDTARILFGQDNENTLSMELMDNEKSLLKLESIVEGNTEKLIVENEGVKVALFSYDGDSGKYDLSIEYYIPLLTVRGIMQFSEKEFKITADEFSSSYIPYNINFSYYVKAGAEMEEISGEEFDLTNTSNSDLMMLYLMLKETSLF